MKSPLKILGISLFLIASITFIFTSCKDTPDKNTNSQHQKIVSAVERLNAQASNYVESNPNLALKYIDSSLSLIKNQDLKDSRIKTLYLRGRCYRMLEKKTEAIASILVSLQLSVEVNNNWYRMLNLEELAEIQYRQLNYKAADSNLNEAELIANKYHYSSSSAAIFNNKAKIADNIGQKTKAIQLYLKTALLFQMEKDDKSLATVYNNLALVYRGIDNYKEALRFLNMAITINTKINHTTGLAENYNNLGVVYHEMKAIKEALNAFKKSQILYKQTGRFADLAKSYLNIANIMSGQKDFSQANAYYDSSLQLCKNYKIEYGIILNEINRGGLYAKMGNHQKAIYLLNSGLKKVKRLQLTDIEIETEELLGESYKALGNSQQSLLHFVNYYRLKDSTAGKEINQQIYELQEKYNMVDREREISQLNESVLLAKERMRKLIIIALSASIVLLTISFFLVLRQRTILNNNRLAKDEHEKTRLYLELKNKELITNALHLASLREFSNQLAEKIQDLLKENENPSKIALTEILHQIKNLVPQGAWKDFETRFEQLHEVFFEKLFVLYPDLSPAEIKICSFLRLSLTTKDIAMLTHRSIRTIETQRMNIRKKMVLSANSSLETHLLTIF